ncbi:hypothetical protein FQA39_LY13225 [Lamprigera yunnana]|nr:hypothetical protein FQA39_LY13225 [Lamprigera yunnana]
MLCGDKKSLKVETRPKKLKFGHIRNKCNFLFHIWQIGIHQPSGETPADEQNEDASEEVDAENVQESSQDTTVQVSARATLKTGKKRKQMETLLQQTLEEHIVRRRQREEERKRKTDEKPDSLISNNATVRALSTSGLGQVEFLRIFLVNANDNGLCTPPAELKCMDATVLALIFIVYIQFGFILIFIYLTALKKKDERPKDEDRSIKKTAEKESQEMEEINGLIKEMMKNMDGNMDKIKQEIKLVMKDMEEKEKTGELNKKDRKVEKKS